MSKRKQSSMDSLLINKSVKQHDRSDTLSEEDADNSELVSCPKKTAKAQSIYRSHDPDPWYVKYGFVSDY